MEPRTHNLGFAIMQARQWGKKPRIVKAINAALAHAPTIYQISINGIRHGIYATLEEAREAIRNA